MSSTMIALERECYSYAIKHPSISYVAFNIFLSRGGCICKILHSAKIRTGANYRLARKSSSRGPNAAFARVTEIRKNFYTL